MQSHKSLTRAGTQRTLENTKNLRGQSSYYPMTISMKNLDNVYPSYNLEGNKNEVLK